MLNTDNLPAVAYFSMEYGLDNRFRAYAGGLGILAGDYIKGAKDYGYPIVAIGIKWKQGYGEQIIGDDGRPQNIYESYQYDFLQDTCVKVTVSISNKDVVCKVWKVDCFGNIPLYLLDTDLPENEDREITSKLYGGGKEERVAQEMVLGIGGVRALRALGINAEVYHFNEGHALLAGFELVREGVERGMAYEEAVELTKQGIVFTTHTPVIEGNESHSIDRLMNMGANNGLTEGQLIEIGGNPFNMTVGALKMSRISNAVSELHRQTANKMWDIVNDKSQIIGITNAIHTPTWVDERMQKAVEGNGDLWEAHIDNKRKLIEFVKERNGVELNADILLIGFSRRAISYKRSNLIFTDESVIGELLNSGKLQLVFAGKAHPQDDEGHKIVENIVAKSKKYKDSVVFLENYDMTIGKMLTRGCDVWLNNPRRPNEASGTSGMKAAMNGVLNLSTLDGWWPEVCNHGINGWQFGDGLESMDAKIQNLNDANSLYEILQEEVMETYYNNRSKWIDMMKNSILSTRDRFSMKRMLKEYYKRMYIK